MRQHDVMQSGAPAMLVLSLLSDEPSRDFAWAHGGRGQAVFEDDKLCYRRNKSEYADGLRLTVRLKRGYEYEFRVSISKLSSSVDVQGPSWRFSVDKASAGMEFAARFVAESSTTEIFFQTPNDWWGAFDISTARLIQLTLPQRDYFAGTLSRSGPSAFHRGDARSENAGSLDTVLCPLTPRELPQLLANLERWDRLYLPAAGDEAGPNPELVLSFSCEPREAIRRAVDEAVARLDRVRNAFSAIAVMFCDLSAEKDVYVRDARGAPPKYGFKAGPNWLFYESITRLRPSAGMVFLMECDCRPVTPGWLRRLNDVARVHADAWVVGGIYSGVSGMDPRLNRHINGNALYNIGDTQFRIFLEELWDWMQNYIKDVDPNLAYDCAWEIFVHSAHVQKGDFDYASVVRKVASKFRAASFVVNVAGQAEQNGRYIFSEADLKERFPDACLVHGPMSETKSHCRGVLSVGKQLSEDDVRPHESYRRTDVVFDRSFWLTNDTFRANDRVEFALTAEGFVGKNWRFKVAQLSGEELAAEVVDVLRQDNGDVIRICASVPFEMSALIFKIDAAVIQPKWALKGLDVRVERSGRALCDFVSLT